MAAIAPLKFLTVPALSKHTATVIFVHGLGDTGHGWKPVADMFRADPALSHVKWVLPHSPIRAVTANMGMEMPSWFDIVSFGFKAEEDTAGMLQSSKSISELITAEISAGLDPSRIVLGGFSQGASMSFLTGLTIKEKLAGLVCLSGWLPLREKFLTSGFISPHATSLPIFVGQGADDPLVKPDLSQESVDILEKQLGLSVTRNGRYSGAGISYNVYPGVGHSTNQKELDDVREWIVKAIPKSE